MEKCLSYSFTETRHPESFTL